MAKYERRLTGDMDALLHTIDRGIIGGSISAGFEASSDFYSGSVRCAVRVYERFSIMGGNRLSLNVTVLGTGRDLQLSAITAGGGSGVFFNFFKADTTGEGPFLRKLTKIVEDFITQ